MAARRSFAMLDPRVMMRNPVMFLVEVGTVLTAIVVVQSIAHGALARPDRLSGGAGGPAAPDGPLRQLRRGAGRGPRQGPGRQPPPDPPGHARLPARQPDGPRGRGRLLDEAPRRRPRARRGRAGHPGRRRGRRGRRQRGRERHHRRERPGDPRGRRRPLGRHRRHPRALRPDRRPDHRRAGPELPRQDDRPGRGRRAAEDAQRDRTDDRPGRLLADLPDRHRHALPDGLLLRPGRWTSPR